MSETTTKTKQAFSRKERQDNMKFVLEAIPKNSLDFNELMFTFADIIQSSFMNGLFVGKSKEEREELQDQIIELNNKVIDALRDGDQTLMIDMVVLSNLIMDAINNAQIQALEVAEGKTK